ncbi:heavy metal-binding domain-containing protein [Candidatus Fukatsuia symbiotica]|uniref:UPF0145 protein CCS41_03620 n=1 Tax=Candidatus Fukatsuia symbiotica TaxID=1878942 RepID=A0A2U8I3S6_9GAMM|nr:heavy metal-binding domain-containing protein [Candidatus Fukatsuia symbiotica]AWK13771.1 hypothetical protein CCS41_03620 [Candidatus Fukatsuia symbiotica]MEA9445955.1 heavy metal-binding domain-containing protein [Candidatus Fukatsuia symbiotica]
MQLSTTPTLQGFIISEYCSIVSSEVMLNINAFQGFLTGIRDLIGGRVKGYELALRKARENAFTKLQIQAEELGAHAVVGITIDYQMIGKGGNMLMICIKGTAVKLLAQTP